VVSMLAQKANGPPVRRACYTFVTESGSGPPDLVAYSIANPGDVALQYLCIRRGFSRCGGPTIPGKKICCSALERLVRPTPSSRRTAGPIPRSSSAEPRSSQLLWSRSRFHLRSRGYRGRAHALACPPRRERENARPHSRGTICPSFANTTL